MLYVLVVLVIFLWFFFTGVFWGVMWAPTRKKDYDRIGKLTILRPGTTFYDLGSGTGDLLFYLSSKYGIQCVGIEIAPILYLYSKIRSLFSSNVEIRFGNFLNHDLSNADVIYCFLLPRVYNTLRKKLTETTMRNSNAFIIFAGWPLEGVEPRTVHRQNTGLSFYLYKKTDLQKERPV